MYLAYNQLNFPSLSFQTEQTLDTIFRPHVYFSTQGIHNAKNMAHQSVLYNKIYTGIPTPESTQNDSSLCARFNQP